MGLLIAVFGGIFYPGIENIATASVLIALGIMVGFLNITKTETTTFLLAAVSLVIVTALGGSVLNKVAIIGAQLEGILLYLLAFIIPAAIIVAIKSIYTVANR